MTIPSIKHTVSTIVALIVGGTLCTWVAAGSLGSRGLSATSFDGANRAFAESHFNEAVQKIDAVITAHGYSAPALFNLGNSYLCAGKTGLAILNYERARLLAPRDPDIAANLSTARNAAGIAVVGLPWGEVFSHGLSLNAWAWLASFALLGMCGALLTGAFWQAARVPSRFAAVGCAVMLAAALGSIVLRTPQLGEAVITTKNVVARISPFASAATAFPLNEGQTVTIKSFHAGYALVTTADDRRGWVATSDFAALIPAQQASAHIPASAG
jgi:tetratricopeptide (TPR) repeat protein